MSIRVRSARCASGLLLAVLGASACTRDATPPAPAAAAPAVQDAKVLAHADLAHRLRRFCIERGAPGIARGQIAADDEHVRLGAFWRARTDTHHFGADFRNRADLALAAPGSAPRADAALRQLRATVDARLPAWQALVDYNAAGTLRDDGGDEGRRLLPWAIAALDAIEVATWAYVDAVEATAQPQ
ncbi:MAG: hypothetical protein ABW163_06930 [Luteimonas sp.]